VNDAPTILRRSTNALGGLLLGAIVGMIVLYLVMVLSGSDFGLDNVRPGAVAGGLLGVIVRFVFPIHQPSEAKYYRQILIALFLLGAAGVSFSIAGYGLVKGKIYSFSRGHKLLNPGELVTREDNPGLFWVSAVIWCGAGVVFGGLSIRNIQETSASIRRNDERE